MSGGIALVAELLPPAQHLAEFTTSAMLEQFAEGAA
jgi:hypothetical protein